MGATALAPSKSAAVLVLDGMVVRDSTDRVELELAGGVVCSAVAEELDFVTNEEDVSCRLEVVCSCWLEVVVCSCWLEVVVCSSLLEVVVCGGGGVVVDVEMKDDAAAGGASGGPGGNGGVPARPPNPPPSSPPSGPGGIPAEGRKGFWAVFPPSFPSLSSPPLLSSPPESSSAAMVLGGPPFVESEGPPGPGPGSRETAMKGAAGPSLRNKVSGGASAEPSCTSLRGEAGRSAVPVSAP